MSIDSKDLRRECIDLDRATVLWYKQTQEDWEYLEAIGLFKKYHVWHEPLQQPDWHAIKSEATFINRWIDANDTDDTEE
jgi:hypothetical protein